jgi:hypothetical protein
MIELFNIVDDNSNKKLSIEEFFETVDLIEKNEALSPFRFRTLIWWEKFRTYMNDEKNLHNFLYHPLYAGFMVTITFTDCSNYNF